MSVRCVKLKNKNNKSAMAYDNDALVELAEQLGGSGVKRSKSDLSRKEAKELNKQLKARQQAAERENRRLAQEQRKKATSQLKEREIELGKKTKKDREKRRKANNVIDFLGYESMFKGGVCEVEKGLYSETCEFDDISYQSAREDDQRSMFSQMCSLYDSFGAETLLQFTIVNTPLTKEEIEDRKFFDIEAQKNEKQKKYAEIYEKILEEKQREGVSNIVRKRYVTYSVGAQSLEEATPQLARIRNDISSIFQNMKSGAHKLDGTDRLRLIQSLLKPSKPFNFDYDKDIRLGLATTTKDCIAPNSIDFKPFNSHTYFKVDDMYGQVLVMGRFGSEISDRVISDIVDMNIPLAVTWFSQGTDKGAAVDYVKRRKTWIDKEVIEEQRNALKQGYDCSILPAELEQSKQDTEEVLDLMRNKNQRFFWFTGLIYTYAPTPEKLQLQVGAIMQKARRNSVDVMELAYRQREGLNSILPLGHNHVDIERSFLTMQMGMLIPFATTEIDDGDGSVWVAQNKESLNLIMNNRKKLASPMGFVSGKPGSGKSFFVKNEIMGTILSNPDDQIIIIDPAGEYVALTKDCDGNVFCFKAGGKDKLNPFDLTDTEFQSFEEQIAFKTEAMLAAAGATADVAGARLSEIDQSFITAAVRIVFEKAKLKGDQVPLMEDFVEELKKQGGSDENLHAKAIELSARYYRYINKPYDFFNAQSNVNFKSRVTDISMKDMPDSMRPFGLVTIFETCRNIMYQNQKKGIRTWLYVDEIQSMTKYDPVLEYFARFVREGRKFGLLFTGITQNSMALLEKEEARDIVLLADYFALLKQDPLDRQQWSSLLNLSNVENGYIGDTVNAGDGLLISGGRHVPFTGNFPKGNPLYDLFDTDPNAEASKFRKSED